MPILNYTTKVPADRTIGQLQKMLAQRGARSISVDYEDGEPAGLDFLIMLDRPDGAPVPMQFRLPCNVAGVLRALEAEAPRSYHRREQAARVAWRILKDWVEAQFAVIDAQQASLHQVFMPYAIAPDGRTLFEHFEADPRRLLSA